MSIVVVVVPEPVPQVERCTAESGMWATWQHIHASTEIRKRPEWPMGDGGRRDLCCMKGL